MYALEKPNGGVISIINSLEQIIICDTSIRTHVSSSYSHKGNVHTIDVILRLDLRDKPFLV